MKQKHKVERGIRAPHRVDTTLLDDLQIGESATWPIAARSVVRTAIARRRERTGRRFVTRTVAEGVHDLVRVWRTQ